MSFFKNIKEFIHNVTTQDHYAQYDAQPAPSRSRNASPLHGLGVSGRNGSQVSLHNNASTVSLQNRPSTSNSSSNVNLSNLNNANRSSTTIPYRPGMRSQLNNDSQIELRNYENGQPVRDMGEIWDKIDDWLENEFPELGDDLQDGATSNDLNAFENDLDINLPSAFRESYQIHDGQVSMGKTRGLVFTYPLMDLESIAAETNIWRKVYEKYEKKQPELVSSTFGIQRSCPPMFVNETYYDPLWIPFVKDNVGNNIALDLNPNEGGKWGQVILYGREYNVKFVVADSFSEFMSNLSEELENELYEIDEDEELNYIYKGRVWNYFEVLKLKSIARAKKIDPNFTLNEGKYNDADLLVKKQRNTKGINIKRPNTGNTVTTSTNVKSSGTEVEVKNEELTKETIIAPVYQKDRNFTPSKENIATNDSFVIDEDLSEVEGEEEAEAKIDVEDVVKAVEEIHLDEDVAEEAIEETVEAVEETIEPVEEETAEGLVEPVEPVEEPVEPVEELAEEPTTTEAEPITEETEPVETVEEPTTEEVTETADVTQTAESESEAVEEAAEEAAVTTASTTASKKSKKNKKKGKK